MDKLPFRRGSKASSGALILTMLIFTGCQAFKSTPVDPNMDVHAELSNVERDLVRARTNQVDVLSPEHFADANKAFHKAQKRVEKHESEGKTQKELAEARAYLDKANETAAAVKNAMPETFNARTAALLGGADQTHHKELKRLDAKLKDTSEEAEDGKFSRKDFAKVDKKLAPDYQALELEAIKSTYLGKSQALIEDAKKEKANRYANRTLDQVERQYASVDNYITANRHDPAIGQKAADLNAAAERLVNITREAKRINRKDAEAVVIEKERTEKELAKQQEALANAKATNQQLEGQVAEATAETQALESAQERFDNAKMMFSENEANVKQQDQKLVISLVGLDFASGQSEIAPDKYETLNKVQEAISTFRDPSIVVEGHTDSTGSAAKNRQLSEARAQAVAMFLTAQGIPEERISIVGYGEDKPIATNETKEGRKQNRRVDVVIEEMRAPIAH